MKICGVCGCSFDEIAKSQTIGCSECYYAFAKEFRDTLKEFGIGDVYKGSLPKRLKGYRSNLVDRMTMQIKLEEAIAAEEYEKAALYRDYLKVLNHGTDTNDGQQ